MHLFSSIVPDTPMEFAFPTLLIVPLALGLLGFVEPCTVGGHLVILRAIGDRTLPQRFSAALVFALVRTLVMGLVGALIAQIGSQLIGLQTAMWVVFGSIYLIIGLAYASDRAGELKRSIEFAPVSWRIGKSPAVLGAAFGLNIPACAAPILFGLLAMAATSGAMLLGLLTMAVFALALSAPLLVLVSWPAASAMVSRLASGTTTMRWAISIIFIALGSWSIWFGLFVNPADWAIL